MDIARNFIRVLFANFKESLSQLSLFQLSLWGFENVSEHSNCQILEIFKMARRPIKLLKRKSEADFYIILEFQFQAKNSRK